VAGDELAVEQGDPGVLQGDDQPGQGHFRSVGRAAEHAFAAEHPVETHAVEPTDQLPVQPAFQRMSLAQGVERAIARRNPLADPAIGMPGAGGGAGGDHLRESGVAGHREATASQHLGQRVRAMEPLER